MSDEANLTEETLNEEPENANEVPEEAVQEEAVVKAPRKTAKKKAEPAAPPPVHMNAEGCLVYRSRNKEARFDVLSVHKKWAGLYTGDGHIEWHIRPEDQDGFERHHHYVTQRIVRKAVNV